MNSNKIRKCIGLPNNNTLVLLADLILPKILLNILPNYQVILGTVIKYHSNKSINPMLNLIKTFIIKTSKITKNLI